MTTQDKTEATLRNQVQKTTERRARGVAQVVEHLPSKWEALSSKSPVKGEEKKKNSEENQTFRDVTFCLLSICQRKKITALLGLPDSNTETDTAKTGNLSRSSQRLFHSTTDAHVSMYTSHLLFFV
jgi:hypothetical protein